MRKVLVFAVIAALACGCATFQNLANDEKAQLAVAVQTYNETLTVLIAAQKSGVFDPTETEFITRSLASASSFLDQWRAHVDVGEPMPNALSRFTELIQQLAAYQAKAKGAK